MAPYFFNEGKNLTEWKGQPTDIRDDKGKSFGVSVNGVEDPEQIRVSVDPEATTYVLGERDTLIFPGTEAVLNRDSFEVINALTGETLARVTHKEKR